MLRPGIPISAIAMLGIVPHEAGAASGLFNMMRNLGGAMGTAAIEIFFYQREQFHSAIINEHVSLLELATRRQLAELQQYFMSHGFPDPAGALHRDRRRRPFREHGDQSSRGLIGRRPESAVMKEQHLSRKARLRRGAGARAQYRPSRVNREQARSRVQE